MAQAETGTGRLAKSAAAFRTISEVAEELDVPQHVLRFWESKFAQVKPLKRGGGRRYYRPEDVLLLRRIRQCLYQDGYTIKGVQRLLRDGALKGAPPAEAAPSDALPATAGATAEADLQGDDFASELRKIRDDLKEMRDLLRRR